MAIFPTMLNKRATMISNFTRSDLIAVGISYLLLAILKLSGVISLLIIALILFSKKTFQKYFQIGFFKHLNGETKLSWSNQL